MSYQSYSSIGTSRRRGHNPIDRYTDVDRSVYTVGHTLASVVNDPRTAGQTSGGFWGLGHDASQAPTAPPLDPSKYPHVTKADVQKYIDLVHDAYERFIRDRQSLEAFDAQHHQGSPAARASQGEPFLAAVQAVPSQFFAESFFDSWDEFFKQYCKDQSAEELYEQIDQLNKNLDVVELQLLREVASRSESFFQAAATLQDLLAMLGSSVRSIHGLRQTLAAADEQMCSTAGAVKGLQARRGKLQATLEITKGLEEVTAAQQALDCLLESQDYAGALDLLEQLKCLLEQPSLLGLQCVRHLPPRLADTTVAVEGALANELLNAVANADVARVVAQAASDAESQPDAGISADGSTPGFWQLPQSTADNRSATLPAAVVEQLQDKLLPLAVGLYRCDRLSAALQQYKANVGDEVKSAVRDVLQQVLPVLLAASGDVSSGGMQQQYGEAQLSDQLQRLHHGAFMVLLHAAARVILSCVDHTVCVGQLLELILEGVNTPASQLLSIRKECSAALQVVVDVALGRWVKLLSSRGAAHTRLKQYELKQLLDLSEQVAAYSESAGSRPPTSFRAALQSQCKALLDHSHARCLNQLQHLLESEQWVAVEVPGGFQAIVDRMIARCGEGAALLDGRTLPDTPAGAGLAADINNNSSSSQTASADGAAAVAAGDASVEQHSRTLHLSGKSFHLVNSTLMLLKMLEDYMALYDLMPQFGAEIVHRELELLKLFNSQTAALVLGAGAMRTAGLRSISAKQLALSCQSVAMVATLLPLLRAGSLALVSQPRRALLMPEFDRLLQDLTMHMDEVHSKLVDIMRDRLSAAIQAIPAEVKAAHPNSEQPSHTVTLLARQLGTLRTVLVPLLLREEVEFIFGAVTRAYSDALSELFEVLMAQDTASEGVIRVNALIMLQAFRELPIDPSRASNYSSRLSTTYTKHFGLPPWDQEKLGHRVQQQQQQQQPQLQQQHLLPGQQQMQQPDGLQQQAQLQQFDQLPDGQQHQKPQELQEVQQPVSPDQDEQQASGDEASLDAYQQPQLKEQQQSDQQPLHQQQAEEHYEQQQLQQQGQQQVPKHEAQQGPDNHNNNDQQQQHQQEHKDLDQEAATASHQRLQEHHHHQQQQQQHVVDRDSSQPEPGDSEHQGIGDSQADGAVQEVSSAVSLKSGQQVEQPDQQQQQQQHGDAVLEPTAEVQATKGAVAASLEGAVDGQANVRDPDDAGTAVNGAPGSDRRGSSSSSSSNGWEAPGGAEVSAAGGVSLPPPQSQSSADAAAATAGINSHNGPLSVALDSGPLDELQEPGDIAAVVIAAAAEDEEVDGLTDSQISRPSAAAGPADQVAVGDSNGPTEQIDSDSYLEQQQQSSNTASPSGAALSSDLTSDAGGAEAPVDTAAVSCQWHQQQQQQEAKEQQRQQQDSMQLQNGVMDSNGVPVDSDKT